MFAQTTGRPAGLAKRQVPGRSCIGDPQDCFRFHVREQTKATCRIRCYVRKRTHALEDVSAGAPRSLEAVALHLDRTRRGRSDGMPNHFERCSRNVCGSLRSSARYPAGARVRTRDSQNFLVSYGKNSNDEIFYMKGPGGEWQNFPFVNVLRHCPLFFAN